jgi:uncharacterized protein (TIGR02444 family)
MNDSINFPEDALLDNPFWQFSLTVYQQASCAAFLLDAQDRFGLDVNILLFIGWLAHRKKVLRLSSSLKNRINDFQQNTILPIRKIRITSKGFNNIEFYDALKKLELAAENIEQQRLYRLSDQMPISNEGFKVSIEQSYKVYVGQMDMGAELIKDKDWLQTLIQYLQPGARRY